MRKAIAFLITAVLIAGAILFSYRQRESGREEPETAVWRMFEHSRSGSVRAYLDCFTGGLRAKLDKTSSEMTADKFSEFLKESSVRVKGVAVYDVQRTSERSATLVVEYVYEDQNERQRTALRLEGGTWRIESAESSQRVQPLIPYGKPVSDVQ